MIADILKDPETRMTFHSRQEMCPLDPRAAPVGKYGHIHYTRLSDNFHYTEEVQMAVPFVQRYTLVGRAQWVPA